ncbi:MAG: hypothetical protein JWN18_113 [Parcubacteria group bacterium]|nr:hypothetical protein [Parcubacteria group bacterium]
MSSTAKKWSIAAVGIAVVLGGALTIFWPHQIEQPAPVVVQPAIPDYPIHSVIGFSVEHRTIDSYTYGTGPTRIAFIGGIHGGLEWNSVILSYQLMDYLKAHPETVPASLSVTVIPDVNPDGVHKALGTEGRFAVKDVPAGALDAGRFNAHGVDLNRNFNCRWVATSTWKGETHSAGTAAFSEPEAQAIRNFVATSSPKAVIFFHSQAGAVYASECGKGVLPQTIDIMNTYARAAGYLAIKTFDAYPTPGDSEGWLASIGIPAITVELTTHDVVEWEKNLAGVKAVIQYYKLR